MDVTVGGKKIEARIDAKGIFRAEWNGEDYEHVTLQGLKDALARQIKKKPVAIPVLNIDEYADDSLKIVKGVVTGRHSGNGNLLVRFEGNRSPEQFRPYRSGGLLKGSADVKELRRLYDSMKAARKAFDDFKEECAFDSEVLK